MPGGSNDQEILIVNPKGIFKLYLMHDLLIKMMDEQYALLIDLIKSKSNEFEQAV